ncbi:class I SAM-dependent methyltransferase [Lentilitoribacter sp. Alg239-R112]|uniref:class I SAM-dependent methyltransferase n=1 Tax=Lentilitoribacter sp. Alg239-R112 TaxID=2305987 RepID=UPI0013A6B4D7|nr:class I SAM-dependent methyltransferase [Lentilitoribacter sp. Alg239-R112]
MLASSSQHQSLMNHIYSKQRHIYDATRKFYLLGRDQMIMGLRPPNGGSVLEIGCGTGRNLVVAAGTRRRARYFGLDISIEMLKSADKLIKQNELQDQIKIANADATDFNPQELFGVTKFDRIFISYSLSMMPYWKEAVDQALIHLSEKGSLHIVDFGQQSELPKTFRSILRGWLKLFHVSPRTDLLEYLSHISQKSNRGMVFKKPYRDYTTYCVIGPQRN